MKKFMGLICIMVASITALTGCGALTPQSGGSGTSGSSQMTGRLQINLTDAPAEEEIEEVRLTVHDVSIHAAGNETSGNETEDGNWLPLQMIGNTTFNLLELQNGLQAKLAFGDLDPGKYTQIRMNVTSVEIKVEGDPKLKDAKLPSNNLKFVHPFEIVQGQETVIVFDFDAQKSINVTGNGQYMCKPVVKLTTTKDPASKGPKAPEQVEITPVSLPNGGNGTAYGPATLTATGGVPPYTWGVTNGAIPAGLIFNGTTGIIDGTPTLDGDFTFTVKAEDSTSPVKLNATRTFTVNIAAQDALQIVTTSLPDGTAREPYSASLQAIGGIGNKTWSLAEGSSLPAELSLDPATGAVSGTPTAKGNYSFTVGVKDEATPSNNTDTQIITIQINKGNAS